MNDSESAARCLMGETSLANDGIVLDLSGFKISIRSNSSELLDLLGAYFRPLVSTGDANIDVVAIEDHTIEKRLPPEVVFTDWKREPGKRGRKDACHDLVDGRLIRKIRTGMLFLQSKRYRIARGPCLDHDNQLINFINSQYMNWLQQNGALICHASGVLLDGICLGIAGLSGGGKSTLLLHLMEDPSVGYLTNDRLFLQTGQESRKYAVGIPKMPRVNPGTILNLPKLRPLLNDERRAALLTLEREVLWHLEDKHDVNVEEVYGPGRIVQRAPLGAFLILNWHRNVDEPCVVSEVELEARRDLLAALTKSRGPFYQSRTGTFDGDEMKPDIDTYLIGLKNVPIWEVRGRVDFHAAAEQCRERMRTAL